MLEHCQAPRSSPRRPTSSRSTVPRCRRTSRRLRDVPSSRFTRHRPSGAMLQRRFGGSASNAPREQPTGNLDGRRIKCSTMMAAALHGQNENYPPTHIPKSTRSPFFAQQPLTITSPPWPSGPSENASPAQRGPRREVAVSPRRRRPGSGARRLLIKNMQCGVGLRQTDPTPLRALGRAHLTKDGGLYGH